MFEGVGLGWVARLLYYLALVLVYASCMRYDWGSPMRRSEKGGISVQGGQNQNRLARLRNHTLNPELIRRVPPIRRPCCSGTQLLCWGATAVHEPRCSLAAAACAGACSRAHYLFEKALHCSTTDISGDFVGQHMYAHTIFT